MLKKHKIFTCCIIGVLAFSSQTTVSNAKELPIAFAKVTNYVNVRETASEESKIVGKLYNGSSATIRDKIVKYALQFEGNPYVWGGTSLTNGADCSGFTQSVYRDNGISIPRTSKTQAVGGRRISINEIQPGDLIFYDRSGTINHVGIFIGDGKVISASSPSTGIRITDYNYRQPYLVVSYISD